MNNTDMGKINAEKRIPSDRNVSEDIAKRLRQENGKVVAIGYARTSTSKDSQKDSIENQKEMIKTFCEGNPNIDLLEIYVDEAKTGKNDINRDNYNAMMNALKEGNIDLVIVKNKNRLQRDMLLSEEFICLMREYRFTIKILSNGKILNVDDANEMISQGVESIIDSACSATQSAYGRMTHKMRCNQKRLSSCNAVHGYMWNRETKDLEVVEHEADVIRQVFELFVYKDMGVTEIARILESQGIVGKVSGKRITPSTLNDWLRNSAYVGDFYINKRGSNFRTGHKETERFVKDKKEWILVERPDLAIIDRKLFELAQKIRQERIHIYDKPSKEATQAHFKGRHTFSGLVRCGSCGTPYIFCYADRQQTIPIYHCDFKRRHTNTGEECHNHNHKRVTEALLEEVTRVAINNMLSKHEEIIENLIDMLKGTLEDTDKNAEELKKITAKLNNCDREINSLYHNFMVATNDGLRNHINQQLDIKDKEKEKLEARKKDLESIVDNSNVIQEKLTNVKAYLKSCMTIKKVDRSIALKFIDRIIINEDGTIAIALKVGSCYSQSVPSFDAQRQAVRNEQPLCYVKDKAEFWELWKRVCWMYGLGMMEVFRLAMQTQHMT